VCGGSHSRKCHIESMVGALRGTPSFGTFQPLPLEEGNFEEEEEEEEEEDNARGVTFKVSLTKGRTGKLGVRMYTFCEPLGAGSTVLQRPSQQAV